MKNQNSKTSEEKVVEKSTKYIDIFRKNIDMLMAEYDYTIKETAEIADISYDTLKTFLYDKEAKDCRLSTAVKLARAFNLSIDELVAARRNDIEIAAKTQEEAECKRKINPLLEYSPKYM